MSNVTESNQTETFPIDGQLLMVLPRAGASIKNPDIQLPIFHKGADGYYLEMQVKEDPTNKSEIAVTRRIPLDSLSKEDWDILNYQYENLDFKVCQTEGISKGLEKIEDRRIQRLLIALMTFLNPRQVAIVFHLYRLASQQGNTPLVSFRSNNLLESLGYSRGIDGSFTSRSRSQLNQDLVALHRTELVIAQSLKRGDNLGAKVIVKSILRIRDYEIDNVPRNFDLLQAADYTYELADAYTVALEFFDGPSQTGDYVLFDSKFDTQQKLGNNASPRLSFKIIGLYY